MVAYHGRALAYVAFTCMSPPSRTRPSTSGVRLVRAAYQDSLGLCGLGHFGLLGFWALLDH